MKQTLLFSNIIGNICEDDESCVFNDYMNEYLIKHNIKNKNLVFINAKGLGGEENYLNNIIRCFKNINIDFSKIYEIDEKTNLEDIKNINFDNSILFLMGGNPIVQYNEIKRLDLNNLIQNFDCLVIGFCAGAINLSKIAIITSDEDFLQPSSYEEIWRVNLVIEPHYNQNESDIELTKRNNEIQDFANQYKTEINALPDESIIVVEDDYVEVHGKGIRFEHIMREDKIWKK